MAIWNRAKGKEKDALLWGDEVCFLSLIPGQRLKALQIEYLVVDYTDNDPKVTLSLRQADILHALAHDDKLRDEGGCVPDLQAVDKSRYGSC